MSTPRYTKPPFANQPGCCSWCGTRELPKGRQSWCSQACVDAYLMVSDSNFIRRKVFERDKGICEICGCDADKEYEAYRKLSETVERLTDRLMHQRRFNVCWVRGRWQFVEYQNPDRKEVADFRRYMMRKYAPGNWTSDRTSGWDADHIVPVAEGGGECDLSNLRTACIPCHKQLTKELAARLAERRKKNKTPQTP